MTVVDIPVGELIPYSKNPRKNDSAVDAVAASIKQFGFKVPVVIDSENVIVCGHTRYKAAKKLKLKEIPCVVADDLTEEQIKAFRLADNKVGELAEWDLDLLDGELDEIFDIDMAEFGFDLPAVEEEQSNAIEDDFDEEPPADPISKFGDIWKLGRHRLMCGDSTNIGDVKKLMCGEFADMLLTDPPYNVAYQGKTKEKLTIQNDSMLDADFREFLRKSFDAANEVMKPGAVFYIWHADLEGYNFRGACYDIGWKVREVLIWNKNSMVLGRQDYQWKHEPCLYGWKGGGVICGQVTGSKPL